MLFKSIISFSYLFTHLLFGEWTDVERPGGVVPDGLIPQPILKFVAANYPGRHVRGVERDGRNHEVSLDNGLELKFNRRFRLVETDH